MKIKSNPRCLFTAEAFGFGPASKLLAILRHLPGSVVSESSFVGHGCAHELCSSGAFERIIHADPTDCVRGSKMAEELERHDILISAMEFTPLAAARDLGLYNILFDSLFWMWPQLPCDLELVDLYLCQNFVGVSERRSTIDKPHRILITPPLTESNNSCWRPGSRVLLNFGGMDNPVASRDKILSYARGVMRIVARVVSSQGRTLDVFGRSWVMDQLANEFDASVVGFHTTSPREFIRQLQHAHSLITSPGLEVLYEAFTLGVPTFLLPAQNNSQAYQADILHREITSLPGVQWTEMMTTDLLAEGQPAENVILEALHCGHRLCGDLDAQRRLSEELTSFLKRPHRGAKKQCDEQLAFVNRMRQQADVTSFDDVHDVLAQILAEIAG